MSNLPAVDNLKVAQRSIQKLTTQISEGMHRESQLEILAEALRDERDAARSQVEQLQQQQGEQ
jgi:hypothetical protein